MRKIILAVMLTGFALVLSGCVLPKEETLPESQRVVATKAPTGRPVNINFTQTGNLSKEGLPEPRLGWLLLYEKPGNPALTVTLKFTQESICEIAEAGTKCDENKFIAGDRVTIEGERVGDTVTVAKLTVLLE